MRPVLQPEKALKKEPSLTRSMAWSHTVHGIRKGRGRYRTSAVENMVSPCFLFTPLIEIYEYKANTPVL